MPERMDRQYLCIDLKSFYASVECVERGLDPMTTDLVVADPRNYTPDAGGTFRFPAPTNSHDAIVGAVVGLFEGSVDRARTVHNLMLNFNGVEPEGEGQLSLFDEPEETAEERSRQEAILDVKRKFGKNALLKGIDLMPQATQRDRNRQLGGHKSGE